MKNGKTKETISLRRKLDRTLAQVNGSSEEIPVKLVWARPITGRGKEIAVIDDEKQEVCLLESLESLEPESRSIAEADLRTRYLVPRVTRVIRTEASSGNRYWEVESDRGKRTFVMKDPQKNISWINDNHLVIRDTIGNRYEITALSELDDRSQKEIEKVI